MASIRAIWGIEIGQCALKAVKLRPTDDGKVELLAFDLIEHPKILSQPDAAPDELIKAALEKFVSRNEFQGDKFVFGVPGQQTFARFCKLPPVDEKKIPEIVRFEAGQQIPFDMADVVWDYQVFRSKDLPDVEVGIFAMRKDLIRKHLDAYAAVGITPIAIQPMPSALYNFCRYDVVGEITEGTATIVIDVGAEHTDLVVVEPHSAWTRNIPLGGNAFTEALVKAFKLNFAKAEQLKRTAVTSKHARQIFQAMRPVFADLVAEIQRSLGFYGSTHRATTLNQVLVCGNAFQLTGLKKYLENNLNVAGGVRQLEKFNQMVTTATTNAPQFTDNILSFAGVYGLALQGLGLSTISANLLPPELARVAMWHKKRPYFAAAAACVGLAASFPWLRTSMDMSALASTRDLGDEARRIVEKARNFEKEFAAASTDTGAQEQKIKKLLDLSKDRDVVPLIMALLNQSLPEIDPALAAAKTPADLKKVIASDPARFDRTKRGEMTIEGFSVVFDPEIDKFKRTPRSITSGSAFVQATGGRAGGRPTGEMARRAGRGEDEGGEEPASGGGTGAAGPGAGFYVSFTGYLLYGQQSSEASSFLESSFYPRLRELFNQPGLGFHMPETDPQSNDPTPAKRNLYGTTPQPRFQTNVALQNPLALARPGANPTDPDQVTVLYPDPVTGEEMAKDWVYEVSFKLRLGEAPAKKEGTEKP